MKTNKMRYDGLLLTILIASTSYIGDEIVFRSRFSKSQIFKALSDNIIHALIGCFSSLLFFSYDFNFSSQAVVYNVAFCTVISSFIDFDHVLAARSLLWKDITSANRRGILHCTSINITIILLFLIYSYKINKNNYIIINYMLLLAFLSHQIRDANRRGLWFYPFGNSVPINTYIYIAILSILPSVLYFIYKYTKPAYRYTTIVYENV